MGSSFSCHRDGQIVEQGHLDIDVLHSASRTLSMTHTPRGESSSAEAQSFASDMTRHSGGSDRPSPQPGELDVPHVGATNTSIASLSTTSSILKFESSHSSPTLPLLQPIHHTPSSGSADSLLSPISPSYEVKLEQEFHVISSTEAEDHEFGSCVLSTRGDAILSITTDSPAEQLRPLDIAPLERQHSSLSPSTGSPHPMAKGSGFTSLNDLIREERSHDNKGLTSPSSVLGKVVLLRAPIRSQSIAGDGSRVATPVID